MDTQQASARDTVARWIEEFAMGLGASPEGVSAVVRGVRDALADEEPDLEQLTVAVSRHPGALEVRLTGPGDGAHTFLLLA